MNPDPSQLVIGVHPPLMPALTVARCNVRDGVRRHRVHGVVGAQEHNGGPRLELGGGTIDPMSNDGDGAFDDFGDPSGNVPFSMDYVLALKRARASLTTLQVDLLSALVTAPGNELSGGQIAKLLGLEHHAGINSAIVSLAKKLTKTVGVEAPTRNDGTFRWWHVVATGRSTGDRFFWRLRPALRDAAVQLGVCTSDDPLFADGVDLGPAPLFEGALKVVRVNAYERNPVARRRCIEHHGTSCAVCEFSFAATYGPIAEGVIHVHHLRPIADCGGEDYQVDPITELRPVCPNCHVVLHLRRPPLSIEELRTILSERREPSRPPPA